MLEDAKDPTPEARDLCAGPPVAGNRHRQSPAPEASADPDVHRLVIWPKAQRSSPAALPRAMEP
ncbi:hypothetical protein Acid7E03_27140 [Acidisoma sp. 7E03]